MKDHDVNDHRTRIERLSRPPARAGAMRVRVGWPLITAALAVVVLFTFSGGAAFSAQQPSADLDQCRNGAPLTPNDCKDLGGNSGWVNGNVGASQSHLVEGYSTPFRAVMKDLPIGTPITIVIGYDVRNSSKNAYDYLTQYQRLDDPTGSHQLNFGHPPEQVFP